MPAVRAALTWAAVAAFVVGPLALAASSPLNAFRPAIYTISAFAGIVALGLLLLQPLLVGGYLPGFRAFSGRRAHRWSGAAFVAAIAVHVAGLGWSSPPDMADALLFASPTLFTPFGVVAMWAAIAVAIIALLRRRLGLRTWRLVHLSLAVVIAGCSAVHALLIEGTMETMSKVALCVLVVAAALKTVANARGARRPSTPD